MNQMKIKKRLSLLLSLVMIFSILGNVAPTNALAADLLPPKALTISSATEHSYVTDSLQSYAALTWSAASNAVSYAVYRKDLTVTDFVYLGATNQTSYKDITVVPEENGKLYTYSVSSVDANNNVSIKSEAISVKVFAPVYVFDFGGQNRAGFAASYVTDTDYTGAVQPGYTEVTPLTVYGENGKTYGFKTAGTRQNSFAYDSVNQATKGNGWALKQDMIIMTESGLEFKADLPNGNYAGWLLAGDYIDPSGKNTSTYIVDGKNIGTITTAAKEMKEATFEFTVEDGTMNLTTTGNWGRTSALIITPVRVAPTGFAGTVNTSGTASANLTWNPNGAESYNIYRGLSGIENYALVAQNITGSAYVDTTVVAGEEYVYKISANYLTGESVKSDKIIMGVYNPNIAKPVAPVNSVGTRDTTTTAKLTWDTVSNANNYYIWRALESDKIYSLISNVSTNSFNDANLEPNKNYVYKIIASNVGGKSLESAETLVKALIPTVPQNVTVNSVSYESAALIWNASYSANGYKVYKSETEAGTYEFVSNVTYANYTDSGLKASTDYYYKITAFNEGGESDKSITIKATTKAMPDILPAPENFAKTGVTATNVKLGWNAVMGALKYRLYKSTASDGTYELLSELDALSYTDTNVTSGTTYYYKITTVNAAGESAASNVVAASTYTVTWLFDFGANTNYLEGATPIKASTALYSADKEYGFDKAIWREYPRSASDGLLGKGEDFALVTDATNLTVTPIFKAKVPNGNYCVSIYSGELSTARGRSNFNVYLEDTLAGLVYVDKGAGVKEKTFMTTVTDGVLDMKFQALKAGEYIRLNDIAIAAIPATADLTVAPKNLTVSNTSDRAALTWTTVEGATGYNVYRAMTNNKDYLVNLDTTTTPSYMDSVRTTVPYYYSISAITPDGETAKSEIVQSNVVASMEPYEEKINRELVAVKTSDGVFLSWRLFDTDTNDTYFNVYRDGVKITATGNTNYLDAAGTLTSKYSISAAINGNKKDDSKTVNTLANDYLSVKLTPPPSGVNLKGESYFYKANDASVADLDGDGEYEIVLKWDPSNSQDNSAGTYTGNTYYDAYKLDGTRLWRIDMGKNIRSGAHYSPFMVYDYNGDGKAEMVAKTADGTIDGLGNIIGRWDADYIDKVTNISMILSGPEYLTVFDGVTGRVLDTVNYEVARGNVTDWGDASGNRVDRFLAATAYLDGETPSFIMCRGYYAKSTLTAYTFKDGQIKKLWSFNTDIAGSQYMGQGNHNLTVTDVDNDGCDEIIYGALTINNDGTPMYTTGLKHGDALHVSDIDLDRPGLEVFQVHEETQCSELHDALTGEILWKKDMLGDVGRGVSADIDPTSPGMEAWNSSQSVDTKANIGVMSSKGEVLQAAVIPPVNFAVWWDGDLLRELFDGSESNASNITPYIYKYKDMSGNMINDKVKIFEGMDVNNYTKGNPCLVGDIMGDWREEVMLRSLDNTELRIYTTTIPTEYRLTTLVQDHQYRMALAWQNVGYNQPPHTSYYLGSDMQVKTAFSGKIVEDETPPIIPPTPSGDSNDGSSTPTTSGSTVTPVSDDNLVIASVQGNNTPLLTVGTDNKVELKKDTVEKLIASDKDLVITSGKASVTLNNQLLHELAQKSNKPLEVKLEKIDEKLSKTIKEQVERLKNMTLVGTTDSVFSLSLKSETVVEKVNEPLVVSISVDKENIKDKSKLTVVRYEPQQDGSVAVVKIGGTYDEKSGKFNFAIDKAGIYGLIEASDVLRVNLTINSKKLEVNGIAKENDVAPVIINNRTMLPVRSIVEDLHGKVDWNSGTGEVTITIDGQAMNFKVGEQIPGFDTAPVLINDRAFVPIRYISEKIGANVLWVPSTERVEIVK